MTLRSLLLLPLVSIVMATASESAQAGDRLLDDFSRDDGRSTLGPAWSGFTDRVMGGRSGLQAGHVETEEGPALRMRGTVRLDNNGGFVQVRLPLVVDGEPLDASGAAGFIVEARGAPGPYYLHLRTPDSRRPWAYFRAPLPVTDQWQRIDVALTDFEPVSTRARLDASRLISIGLVAYGEEFEADLEVRRLALKGAADSADNDTAGDR
ncbi:hypothetical protein HFP89_08540 [Wenzhouxiangella sp. XN79A]|uniref:CIA30 family protein n=1 Tax=Wenzhouxiangella sp. XN79A TaxID=2724193 RepID=UPI00144AA82C|nr:CIA30 family protein [Wenzhouxiangella sp. XN79A]NKI35213.1 hypothetical protein [Wenzhouxiangella sp. XN79A]